MSLFVWKPEYSVGSTQIDQEHRQLFAMADELHRAMMEARGNQTLADLLTRLVNYTAHHFASEEHLMRESAYPSYQLHQAEHANLTSQVLEYQKKVVKGEVAVSIQVMQFLSKWLKEHIQGSDLKLAQHLKTRPARSAA